MTTLLSKLFLIAIVAWLGELKWLTKFHIDWPLCPSSYFVL